MLPTLSLPELRDYYADRYDRENLGDVAEADALPGWKCYMAHDGGYLRSGAYGVCRPILGGLCTDARYPTNTDTARCAGIPAEKYVSLLSPRYDQRVNTMRFTPCQPAPSWGCPARCGMHSNLYMGEARSGIPVAALALTKSWGQVIRCDSGIGDAWRAQHCKIEVLFIAEKFSTIRHTGDAERGFAARYNCPVHVVPGAGTLNGLIPVADFVRLATALGLPNLTRSGAPPTQPARSTEGPS